uniref:CBM20 domain-containing protein n=1 Tax=Pyrodinium bahamense TaxID=73915 RepID=A0A7S0AKV0_9DINO
MPRFVGVIFELRRAESQPGEGLCVVGAGPEMGNWRPLKEDDRHEAAEAKSMRTSALMYPSWITRLPIWLCLEDDTSQGGRTALLTVEYKYVRDRRRVDGGRRPVQWEAYIPNRQVSLPVEAEASVWIVSDAQWNYTGEQKVLRATPQQLASRWCALDPEWGRPAPSAPKEGVLEAALRAPAPRHFQLTPREQGQGDTGGSSPSWPIEAEFQALAPMPFFSHPHRGPEPSDKGQAIEVPKLTLPTREVLPPPEQDGELTKLRSENQRLLEAMWEASDKESELVHLRTENARLQIIADTSREKERELVHLCSENARLQSIADASREKEDSENERLRGVVGELCAKVEDLCLENAALREQLRESAATAEAQVAGAKAPPQDGRRRGGPTGGSKPGWEARGEAGLAVPFPQVWQKPLRTRSPSPPAEPEADDGMRHITDTKLKVCLARQRRKAEMGQADLSGWESDCNPSLPLPVNPGPAVVPFVGVTGSNSSDGQREPQEEPRSGEDATP